MRIGFGSRPGVAVLMLVVLTGLVSDGISPADVAAQAAPAPYVPAGLVETERGGRTLDQIADGFPAPAEAATLLRAWGWQANAYFNYAGETASGTTAIEVSLHLFGDGASATEAMSYFAAGRSLIVGVDPVPIGRIGDDVLAIAGRRDGVDEVTIYVRSGALLVRVTAVAPSGDPYSDANETASQFVIGIQRGGTDASARTVEDLVPSLVDLPFGFTISDEGYRGQDEIAGTFLRPAEAESRLSAVGFDGNVYRYFSRSNADSPYPGAATSIEVSLHLFGTANGASRALVYYADGRSEAIGIRIAGTYDIGDEAIILIGPAPGGAGIESTVYLQVGNVLARISAVAPDGDPTADALATAFAVAGRS